ncbi:MAG: retropepsin-like aspartic protease [Thermoguttaceae bacterium]|jgi:hypothetical protein
MADYDGKQFDPPAPVAIVTIRTLDRSHSRSDVAMLIDSGADVTLIPKACAENLELEGATEVGLHLQGFDGGTIAVKVVEAELVFLGRNFHGHFPLIHGECGILGRNVLNNLSLVLDGPRLCWREETAEK